jgi:hypothetical protein
MHMNRVDEPTPEEKRQALDALLASEVLARSGRLRNLLRYIAEAEIEGRGDELNEYVIGVEALARPEGYSTLEDSSVRSRIHELRQRLERFYSTEAPDAPVRIELPKGSHRPRFARKRVTAPTEAAPVKFNRQLLWAAVAGLAVGALATWLVLTIQPDRRVDADAGRWTPALQALWEPFLAGATPILISYESRLFLATGDFGIFRDFDVNEMGDIDSSRHLLDVRKAFNLPQLYENRNYTEFGFIPAGILLTRLLSTKKAGISARRSADLTWSEIRSNNLILLGKPKTDSQIRYFLPQTEFIDEATRIRVLRPKSGEQAEYVEKVDPKDPSNWNEKYAVISFGPGPERGKWVICLAASGAEHPWAVATYLTDPNHANELVEHLRLPSGKLPAAFQVIIRARFKRQEPTHLEYVTHRVLSTGDGR